MFCAQTGVVWGSAFQCERWECKERKPHCEQRLDQGVIEGHRSSGRGAIQSAPCLRGLLGGKAEPQMEEEDEGEEGHLGQSYLLLTATLKGSVDDHLCLLDEETEAQRSFSNLPKVTQQRHGKAEAQSPQEGTHALAGSMEVTRHQRGTFTTGVCSRRADSPLFTAATIISSPLPHLNSYNFSFTVGSAN